MPCASACTRAIYYAILSRGSHRRGAKFSLVYPIARGFSRWINAALGGVTLLDETVSFFGGMGIALVLVGMGLIGLPRYANSLPQRREFIVGAVGRTVDRRLFARRQNRRHPRVHPYAFITGMMFLASLLRWPFVWACRRGTLDHFTHTLNK